MPQDQSGVEGEGSGFGVQDSGKASFAKSFPRCLVPSNFQQGAQAYVSL